MSAADVEDSDYLAFARRIIRCAGRRVTTNVDALPELLALRDELDDAIDVAVAGLRPRYSWGEIADRLGVTRQAAWSRWGRHEDEQARIALDGP